MSKTKRPNDELNEEPTEGTSAAAKSHNITATNLQRLNVLNLILQCDIKPKLQIGAVTTVGVLRGDWPRNKTLKTGHDRNGQPTFDEDGKPELDERDDSSTFILNEDQRIFLADFLKCFFDGELERTTQGPMGPKQEKLKPNGSDLVELMPLYNKVNHA